MGKLNLAATAVLVVVLAGGCSSQMMALQYQPGPEVAAPPTAAKIYAMSLTPGARPRTGWVLSAADMGIR